MSSKEIGPCTFCRRTSVRLHPGTFSVPQGPEEEFLVPQVRACLDQEDYRANARREGLRLAPDFSEMTQIDRYRDNMIRRKVTMSDRLDVLKDELESTLAAAHEALSHTSADHVQAAWRNIQAVTQPLIARLLFEIASDLSAIREALEARTPPDTELPKR